MSLQVNSLQGLVTGVSLTFGGCCSNVYSLEKILAVESHAGTLVTLLQFLFVSFVSWLIISDFKKNTYKTLWVSKPTIPFRRYLISIVLHFSVSTLNNFAFKFHISVPFHIIFRSIGTAVTILIGKLFWGKRYTLPQNIGALLVSIGVAICTLSSTKGEGDDLLDVDYTYDIDTIIGVIVLFIATCLNSVMGLYSEESYRIHGKVQSSEILFYSHFFALPMFGLIYRLIRQEYTDITDHQFWYWTLLNCLTQYICVWGVNTLAISTSSLTVTMVLLIRKLVSLVISFHSFDNKFTSEYYSGFLLAILGSAVYSSSNILGVYLGSGKTVSATKKKTN